MPEIHRCGDSGGVTTVGTPCRRRVLAAGDRCPAHPQFGRIVVISGVPHLDDLGLAVRMGLANPSPEDAAAVFPLFDLLEEEERPAPGELLEGGPVFAWIRPQVAAEELGVTPRHLQNLERKGLPSTGNRESKRYARPHCLIWLEQYEAELERHGRCSRLPFRVAWARHRLELEQAEAAE